MKVKDYLCSYWYKEYEYPASGILVNYDGFVFFISNDKHYDNYRLGSLQSFNAALKMLNLFTAYKYCWQMFNVRVSDDEFKKLLKNPNKMIDVLNSKCGYCPDDNPEEELEFFNINKLDYYKSNFEKINL